MIMYCCRVCSFFFFNDTATTEIYTLSLPDALPICLVGTRHPARHRPLGSGPRRVSRRGEGSRGRVGRPPPLRLQPGHEADQDRKSTRLNSSHANISYAVFCLKKKNTNLKHKCITSH